MTRLHIFLLLLLASRLACYAAVDPEVVNAETKKLFPPIPEQTGLKLEVKATMTDAFGSDGKVWTWGGAHLSIEIALHNTSQTPLTVPSSNYDGKPRIDEWPNWGEGMEHIAFYIEPPIFQGKPTAFSAARFCPVVLAPGEYVLLMHHGLSIKDRKHADAIKEVSVSFSVDDRFAGLADWWRGRLQIYAVINRAGDTDQQIAQMKLSHEQYNAQKEAEKNPDYGMKNAARIAGLIASSDQANIRNEGTKETDGVIVRDLGWIRQVSEDIAATPLPRSVQCFCIGWRTAYFYKDGKLVVSVAAIHGNQLRIYSTEVSGDYRVDEGHWTVLNKVIDSQIRTNHSSEPTPGAVH